MNVKVDEIMTSSVIKTESHRSIDHVRTLIQKNKIGAIPVVDENDEAVGIISATDLLSDVDGKDLVSSIMTDKIYNIPQYDDVSVAARVMRNHKIHHLVVTHEKKVVGILSAFDLLKLVEEHRFVMKQPPTQSSKKKAKRV